MSARSFQTFAEVIQSEHRQLEEARLPDPGLRQEFEGTVLLEGNSGEPWVAQTKTDRVGLALSGGGIRSATFNLGLLQALNRAGILPHVDYLSTVSGGGYLGGFWTAWRQRTDQATPLFPNGTSVEPSDADPAFDGVRDFREPAEIRHLREFSRFLMPRIGANQAEMWSAIAAVLGGMLPALLVTFATLALVFYGWVFLGYFALRGIPDAPRSGAITVFMVVTMALHLWRQSRWKRAQLHEQPAAGAWKWTLGYWLLAAVTALAGAWMMNQTIDWFCPSRQWGWTADQRFVTVTIEPALAWIGLALGIALCWTLIEAPWRAWEYVQRGGGDPQVDESLRVRRLQRTTLRDQLTSRYLAWGVVAAGMAGVWELSRWIDGSLQEQAGATVTAAGGFTALCTGLFVWLRSCLGKFDEQAKGGGWWKNLTRILKTHAATVAAMAGALSFVVLTILLLRYFGLGRMDGAVPASNTDVWKSALRFAAAAAVIVLIALKVFDPAYFGLHDFYRSRIARAFLGAAFVGGPRWDARNENDREIPARLTREALARRELAAQKRAQAASPSPDLSDRDREVLRRRAEELDRLAERLEDLQHRSADRVLSVASVRDNRYTIERPQDDLVLSGLPSSLPSGFPTEVAALRLRPIHLICCAANHLAGDALPNLYRGARSAVLSQRGISLGDETCQPRQTDQPLTLSGALTASAAAFNSQMGEKSIRLGPASCFLMSAFNLRLGLWVQNPAAVRAANDSLVFDTFCLRKDRRAAAVPWWRNPWRTLAIDWADLRFQISRWCHEHAWVRAFLALPGKVFFRELAGDSSCLPNDRNPQIHLSDGGHFENLGLYELIRRHCRYVIVSDAGQDPEVALDDLGNAIRRVREDFGVEIEIDLDPIRPDPQLISRQHLVVGTIHYDGLDGSDRGTLIYLKPSLTGDEPGDIQQYRTRNRIFPHEPTSDQFFAEAQWESYRQLGEHIGRTAFAFLDPMDKDLRRQTETIFWRARHVWSALPDDFSEHFRALTAEVRELDEDLRENAPDHLRSELFPEASALVPKPKSRAKAKTETADETLTPFFLMRAIHLMENAWLTLKLGRHLSHPMYDGWLNYFDRWALAPSFRRWWPILSALYSIDFRDFIKTRYGLRLRDPEARGSDHDAVTELRANDSSKPMPLLELRTNTPRQRIREGHAWRMRCIRRGEPALPANTKIFEYMLHLESADPRLTGPLQIGVAMVKFKVVSHASTISGEPQARRVAVASWESSEFYVPEPLTGSGIYSRFLDRLLNYLKEHRYEDLPVTRVEVDLGGKREDDASRQIRSRMLDFYKSRQFSVVQGLSEQDADRLRVIHHFTPQTDPAPELALKPTPSRKRRVR